MSAPKGVLKPSINLLLKQDINKTPALIEYKLQPACINHLIADAVSKFQTLTPCLSCTLSDIFCDLSVSLTTILKMLQKTSKMTDQTSKGQGKCILFTNGILLSIYHCCALPQSKNLTNKILLVWCR